MKRFGCIGMLVLLLMAACHTPTREGRQMMAQAKALSETAPDNAVKLIDSALRMGKRFSEQQRMDLALLQGELVFRDASIDEEVLPEGVSTNPELERASAYFAKRKEYTKAAHASLYSGYVQQAYGEREKAMRSYKEAEHYGGLANDSLTMTCAYYKMAKYLLNDGMKGEALVTLEKADKVLPSQHGDKALVQNMMAVCYMLQDDLDHSEECLRRGMSYAEHTEANRAKRKIWNNYSVFYCLKGDFPQAVNSLREVAKDTCLDETEKLLYYLNMGKIFMMENASDSAALYFEKLAQLPLLSTIKPESRLAANDALLKYAKEKKNDTLVSFYQKKYEENLFEIMSQRQEQSIFRIQQQYDYEAEKNILNRKIIHRQRVITIISVLLFISSLVILAFQYRNKKLLKEEEEMKRQIDRMKQDLRQSVKPIMKRKSKHLLYYVLLLGIVTCSFFLYSSRYYPLLNSDDALNVLMAHDYSLPDNFYCWGQDRGGTLIPLISQLFIKFFHCSAVMAVSFSNYLVLIIGYLGMSCLIKSNYYKLVLAIIWFFPFQRFIDFLRFPIGVQYSLLGVSVFLIRQLEKTEGQKIVVKHVVMSLFVMTSIIMVWVSDLSIVTIALLMFVLSLYDHKRLKTTGLAKTIIPYSIVGVTFGFLFIRYAKSFATKKSVGYLAFNNIFQIKKALALLWDAIRENLALNPNTNEHFVGIYVYVAILFVLLFISWLIKNRMTLRLIKNKWIAFFLVDTAAVLAILLLSSWVLANQMGRRYFVPTYISFSLFVLLCLDSLETSHNIKPLKYGVLVVALVGAFSPIYTMETVDPKSLKPMVDVVGEFKQLGEIGVISEYWNSYVTSCPDPDLIKATPHDRSDVRNSKIVEEVFERENIYIIKDMWMDAFPDTLVQFGRQLVRNGEEFNIGDCNVCKYRLEKKR